MSPDRLNHAQEAGLVAFDFHDTRELGEMGNETLLEFPRDVEIQLVTGRSRG